MDEPKLIVAGIAGSLRARSFNRALLRAAVELAPENMEIQIFEHLAELPPYDADVDAAGEPHAVRALRHAIAESDALLVATPEYNFGIPGVLKNAIDWASRPAHRSVLDNKPAAIMGVSRAASGTRRAQMQLRECFVYTRTYAMLFPEILVTNGPEKFDDQLRLTDEMTRTLVRELLAGLIDWTGRLRGIGA